MGEPTRDNQLNSPTEISHMGETCGTKKEIKGTKGMSPNSYFLTATSHRVWPNASPLSWEKRQKVMTSTTI